METIAIRKGFQPHDLLLGQNATYSLVTAKIRNAAASLNDGDIFLFTFAGHGFQGPDVGDKDELDFHDESILLFDVELFDDVLRKELWPCFNAGVRILVIADSCHSQTIPANLDELTRSDSKLRSEDEITVETPDGLVARTVSKYTRERHQAEHRSFYENILLPLLNPPINASILALAASRDDETTADGEPNGVYTAAMLKVLRESDPVDYDELVARIRQELANRPQYPTIEPFGQPNQAFRRQKPFKIE
jgi:hypothetical protein